MIDPKNMRKWVLSSTLAGVLLAAPMTGQAALGDQTLKRGMSHDDVRQLQDVLKGKGHFTYKTSTGYFGAITEEAVKQFQREAKITVDGIVGPQTFKALGTSKERKAASASKAKSGTIRSNKLLRIGSRGQTVKAVQSKLKQMGMYTYTIDGIYGSRTDRAVRQFQREQGLQVDGIVGPETIAALNSVQTDKSTGKKAPKKTSKKKEQKTVELAKKNPAPKTDSTSPILRFGARGTQVKDVQKQLKAAGVFPHAIDGVFGIQTQSAVRRFQQQQGLVVDGIVGPQTLAKLQSPKKPKQSDPKNSSSKKSESAHAGFNVIQLVAHAGELIGAPYAWGGTTPSGFDCSGFLVHVFGKQGVTLPRTVAQQWQAGKKVSQPSVGDVVFFETYTSGPSHNGIYVGNGQFIHSGTSTGVTISDLNSSYWKSRYLGAKQLH